MISVIKYKEYIDTDEFVDNGLFSMFTVWMFSIETSYNDNFFPKSLGRAWNIPWKLWDKHKNVQVTVLEIMNPIRLLWPLHLQLSRKGKQSLDCSFSHKLYGSINCLSLHCSNEGWYCHYEIWTVYITCNTKFVSISN